MLKREEVERIKEKYPKGTPIRLYSMEGEHMWSRKALRK